MDAEQALDELYAATLEDFVSERKRLSAALKESGLREEAEKVAKLRKPSVAAWALNQLSRQNRRDVDLLLDAGHRLREAQAGVLGGAEREAFDQARKAEREALSRLTGEAEKLLRARGSASAATLAQIGESLRAASVSPEGRELLARGRFTQPLETQGFDLVAALDASASPAAAGTRRDRAAEQERERAAREALREAMERLREAQREARDAEREAERVRTEAERARLKADEAQARVERAAAEVEEAEANVGRRRGR
jgi:hypothetical protein